MLETSRKLSLYGCCGGKLDHSFLNVALNDPIMTI